MIAFDLLLALYREEARHRAAEEGFKPADWTERAIVERILEHNLHGIDLDPRAVQIAAAALWLKARQASPEARPQRLNLVAERSTWRACRTMTQRSSNCDAQWSRKRESPASSPIS